MNLLEVHNLHLNLVHRVVVAVLVVRVALDDREVDGQILPYKRPTLLGLLLGALLLSVVLEGHLSADTKTDV